MESIRWLTRPGLSMGRGPFCLGSCWPLFSHYSCPPLVTSAPSDISCLGMEVEDQTSQGHHELPLSQRWARDGNTSATPQAWSAAGD